MLKNGIPISLSLSPALHNENNDSKKKYNKQRTFRLSLLAVLVAACISFIAKFLIYLIDVITGIAFYGSLTVTETTPMYNNLGVFVIVFLWWEG